MLELVLKSAFEVKMGPSTSPDVKFFQEFQNMWPNLDKTKFKPFVDDPKAPKISETERADILNFVEYVLKSKQIRDDYEEFFILVHIFFRVKLDVSFGKPGAIHHARWMAKGIYTLRIYLFRMQFKMTKKEKRNILDLCLFIVKVYVKAWYTCPFAIQAPYHDLNIIKRLLDYEAIDSDISRVTVATFQNHLWYLANETVALSFFDENIPLETKRKMVSNLNEESFF